MENYIVSSYPHGTFCWAEISSTDIQKSLTFYTGLFGWEIEETPTPYGPYYSLHIDGKYVAGASAMMPDMQAQGVPSHWENHVAVDDVEAMVDKVKAAGGTVLVEPFDVLDVGRMLMLRDPQGATLTLWQAKSHIGASLVNYNGAMSWNELSTRDAAGAKKFYSDLFGWEFEATDTGYITFKNNGRMNGGMLEMDESYGDIPPHWIVYFTVADLDASLKQVEELGGKVHVPKTALGEMPGHFAVVADPTGAVCTLTTIPTEPWVEG